MPDFPWSPLYADDVFINGDGCIDAVRIHNGHVDFKQRFVRTEKFLIERVARQAVFGKYRNRHTDDPRVKNKIHSTANTHIIWYQNRLLAMKEDSPPYAINPDTLETQGVYDYDGQYKAKTHTAHPKIDPRNGEMVTMGYEAKGDSTTDIAYYLFDKDGQKLEECWVNAPFAGMMHDMAATDKWVVFVLNPLVTVPLELLERGHHHFAWDEEKPAVFGILPRRNPKPEDVKWFHFKNSFIGHTGNAFDGPDGCIYLDTPVNYENMFWFFPSLDKSHLPALPPDPTESVPGSYVRWKLDPLLSDVYVEPQELVKLEGEMPKIDERFAMQPYKVLFLNINGTPDQFGPKGGSWNAIARCNVDTGKEEIWYAGPTVALNEVAFTPRSPDAPEGDGYLISVANRHDTALTCIVILDSAKVAEGPIAIIELPFRLRFGIHGSWVPAAEFLERKELCDMHGVTDEMRYDFENITVSLPNLPFKGVPTLGSMPLNGPPASRV
ncbi:hypothetical protein V491_08973 [Pseudogymnoascus sp. VKM F-3775]|nr:hypothetical protein V491_08973 [Pseudogymnoascus sp. VKM F-3775]